MGDDFGGVRVGETFEGAEGLVMGDGEVALTTFSTESFHDGAEAEVGEVWGLIGEETDEEDVDHAVVPMLE